MPLKTKARGGKIVVINLQKTGIHELADLVIYERIDKVVELLMSKLEIPIPEFRRSYRLQASLSQNGQNVQLKGIDTNGANYTIFKNLKVTGLGPEKQFP